jgi:predicted transcriptional regulator
MAMGNLKHYDDGRHLRATPAEQEAPPELVAAIDRGLAQVAAGQIVPAEPALARLQAVIDRWEAQK